MNENQALKQSVGSVCRLADGIDVMFVPMLPTVVGRHIAPAGLFNRMAAQPGHHFRPSSSFFKAFQLQVFRTSPASSHPRRAWPTPKRM